MMCYTVKELDSSVLRIFIIPSVISPHLIGLRYSYFDWFAGLGVLFLLTKSHVEGRLCLVLGSGAKLS